MNRKKDQPQEQSPKVSYSHHAWQRLRTLCHVLRQTEENVNSLKQEIETKLAVTEKATAKQAEVQSCRISIQYLEQQVETNRKKVLNAKARIAQARICKDKSASDIRTFEDSLSVKKEEVNDKQAAYIGYREQLVRSTAQLVSRRRHLLNELQSIYSIDFSDTGSNGSNVPRCQCKKVYRIASTHVPDALNYGRSRSALEDIISPHLHEGQRIVKLFLKGQEKLAFDYAVFLLNKNIAQLRCDCIMTTADLRCTLENFKGLFDQLCGAKVTSMSMVCRPMTIPAPSVQSSRSKSSLSDEQSVSRTSGLKSQSELNMANDTCAEYKVEDSSSLTKQYEQIGIIFKLRDTN